MKTRNEILATEYHKKYPCSEFEFSDLGDKEHYLPIVENAKEEYSEEMACSFTEWKDKLKPAKDKDCFTHLKLGIGVKLKPYKELYKIYLEHLNK